MSEYTNEEFAELAKTDLKSWLNAFNDAVGETPDYWEGNEVNGLEVFLVSEQGGGEGEGEHVERTFAIAPPGSKVVDGRVDGALTYFEVYGYYESDYGTEWDDISEAVEVTPVDVMVVQYHKKGA